MEDPVAIRLKGLVSLFMNDLFAEDIKLWSPC